MSCMVYEAKNARAFGVRGKADGYRRFRGSAMHWVGVRLCCLDSGGQRLRAPHVSLFTLVNLLEYFINAFRRHAKCFDCECVCVCVRNE